MGKMKRNRSLSTNYVVIMICFPWFWWELSANPVGGHIRCSEVFFLMAEGATRENQVSEDWPKNQREFT